MELKLALRLLGPFLQLICLGLVIGLPDLMRQKVFGTQIPYGYLAYGGFLVGFVMVIVGVLIKPGRPNPSRLRDDERP